MPRVTRRRTVEAPVPEVWKLVADPYASNRASGAFILIDEATNDTVAGGMVSGA